MVRRLQRAAHQNAAAQQGPRQKRAVASACPTHQTFRVSTNGRREHCDTGAKKTSLAGSTTHQVPGSSAKGAWRPAHSTARSFAVCVAFREALATVQTHAAAACPPRRLWYWLVCGMDTDPEARPIGKPFSPCNLWLPKPVPSSPRLKARPASRGGGRAVGRCRWKTRWKPEPSMLGRQEPSLHGFQNKTSPLPRHFGHIRSPCAPCPSAGASRPFPLRPC